MKVRSQDLVFDLVKSFIFLIKLQILMTSLSKSITTMQRFNERLTNSNCCRYITRFNVKDSTRHVILGTQHFKPSEFATQINLSMDNAWGIVRCIIDLIRSREDGKFLIVKDPNKPVIRLYDIPDNTFESDDDSDEEDEGESCLLFA